MVVLDKYDDLDRGLVHALQVDGRADFRLLADVLGVADQTVARRYAKLRSSGALRVVGLTDHGGPDTPVWVDRIVRIRAAPDTAGPIAEALAQRSDTSWINLCSGGSDIVCGAHGPSVDALLVDVLPRTRHVHEVRADQVLNTFYGGRTEPFTKHGPLGLDQIARLTRELPPSSPPPAALDEIDRRLLATLALDGRAPTKDLAEAATISANTVRRRIDLLRGSGVLHLDVDLDTELLQLPQRAMLWLSVAASDLDTTGQRLAGHAEVAFAVATTGPHAIFVSLVTRSPTSLYRYLSTEIAQLGDTARFETATVLRHVKSAVIRHPLGRAGPPRQPTDHAGHH